MPDLGLGEVGPPGKLVSARARHTEHLCDFFNPHQRHGSKTRASSKDSFSKDSPHPGSRRWRRGDISWWCGTKGPELDRTMAPWAPLCQVKRTEWNVTVSACLPIAG